jgi:hypothetical protein
MAKPAGLPKSGGRQKGTPNRATADVKAVASKYGVEAINKLVSLMRAAENDQVKVAACKEILDRAYGKAPQALTVDPGDKAVDFMKELFALVDGQTRGLPQPPATANGSGMAAGQSLPHPGLGRPNH